MPTSETLAAEALSNATGAQLRAAVRAGRWSGPTAGLARGFVQANLVILPAEAAAELAEFCRLNARPCPLIEQTAPGDPEPRSSAPGADLRTGTCLQFLGALAVVAPLALATETLRFEVTATLLAALAFSATSNQSIQSAKFSLRHTQGKA